MKKFILFCIAVLAIVFAVSANTNVSTIHVNMPAEIRVVKDSTFSVRTKRVDAVEYQIKNDTIYFRTTKSDLENTLIMISTPNPDDLQFITTKDYEISYRK